MMSTMAPASTTPPEGGLSEAARSPAGGLLAEDPLVADPVVREPLAIVCGGGAFPAMVARAAEAAGRQVVTFPLVGFAGPEVEAWEHHPVRLGRFGELTGEMRRRGCREVVFIGTVLRPRIRDLRFDLAALRRLPAVFRMLRGGDNHLLTTLAALFEEEGFRLVGAHEVAPGLLVPEGVLGGLSPGIDDLADIETGRRALETLSPLDIGQGVVVVNRHVIAVEAAEGTDLMLARCAELRRIGRIRAPRGVLVKLPKRGQDRRLDLPSLGQRTVEEAAAAGLAGIAVEAAGVIVTDIEGLVRAADAAGIFLIGLPAGDVQ